MNDSTIDIWLCKLNELRDRNSLFLSQLSVAEKIRAERFKFDIHRNRFIASHGFMRTVLAKYLNIKANEIEYLQGEQGKPFLSNDQDDLQFNLSHTQDFAILAVTRNATLGIDIESTDRKTDWQGICKRFFTLSEQEALFSLNEGQQAFAFFDLWTRKEAYMKVIGAGLSLSPLDFSLSVFPEKPVLIHHDSNKFSSPDEVVFSTINLPESLGSYCATLALSPCLCSTDTSHDSKKIYHQLYQFR